MLSYSVAFIKNRKIHFPEKLMNFSEAATGGIDAREKVF